jgi:hypothetical protein
VGAGDGLNYQPVAGMAPLLGKARNVALDLLLSLGRQFRVDQTWLWNDLHTRAALAGASNGSPVYRSLLSRTKLTYQYNRFYAAHVIVDYDRLATNAALNALPTDKRFNVDVLFSYTPIPGTAVYAGYSDLRQNLQLVGQPPRVQVTDKLNMNTGRQLFMKFSYLY